MIILHSLFFRVSLRSVEACLRSYYRFTQFLLELRTSTASTVNVSVINSGGSERLPVEKTLARYNYSTVLHSLFFRLSSRGVSRSCNENFEVLYNQRIPIFLFRLLPSSRVQPNVQYTREITDKIISEINFVVNS